MEQTIAKCLETKLPANLTIDERGVIAKEVDAPHHTFSKNSLENIERLLSEIPISFQKLNGERKYWNTTSTSGRTKCEEWRNYKNISNSYVPPGDFIVAMLLLDYEYKPKNAKKYPEMTFNASYRNMMKYDCVCGLPYTKASELQHKRSAKHRILMNRKEGVPPPSDGF
jgi:hypothetical protein